MLQQKTHDLGLHCARSKPERGCAHHFRVETEIFRSPALGRPGFQYAFGLAPCSSSARTIRVLRCMMAG